MCVHIRIFNPLAVLLYVQYIIQMKELTALTFSVVIQTFTRSFLSSVSLKCKLAKRDKIHFFNNLIDVMYDISLK